MFRIARLLTALLALTLLAANTASAITAVSAEKTVSGSLGVPQQRVGIDTLASSDRVDEKLSLLYDFASDFPVAARGVVAAESRALVPYFPAANGFLGATSRTTLEAGTIIDRYGGTSVSRFFSPAGTPLGARALPPGTAAQGLRSFEVVKALEVEAVLSL